jgi:hypothetical protein
MANIQPAKTRATLPPSMLAGADRTLCEFWDPSAGKTWRILSLAAGGYAFELEADEVMLLRESHPSLAEAVAYANRWRLEWCRFPTS